MKRLHVLVLAAFLAAGCGFAGSGEKELALGYIEWDENVAVANLTRVLLEEELGYDVELHLTDVGPVFRDVASGQLDAFQDIWLPNLREQLNAVKDDVEYLDPWFEGTTAYGIAVPDYMEIRSLAQLDEAGTDMIYGIEPGAAFHPQISRKVLPGYHLDDMKLVEATTPAMLAKLEEAYSAKEPFVFLAWSPHWINARYEFHYLEDPKDLQGKFNDPSEISSIVRDDLKEDDPAAYAFLAAISLDEEQLNQLEAEINEARNPVEGVEAWLEDNRDVVRPWIEAANNAEAS